MKVYVIGSSALYFWRHCPRAQALLKADVHDPLNDCPLSSAELDALDIPFELFGNRPLRLMVPSGDLRFARRRYKYSIYSRPLPAHAFKQLGENICVASPELCLLQSQTVYPTDRLMELIMELCGRYALDAEAVRGFVSREYQLATIDSVRDFLECTPGVPGKRNLLDVCRFVKENSRSPMETREYLLACLPKRLGGYALPFPELNARLDLSPDERRAAKRKYIECDMCWEDQKVVVEYDGHDDHESREDRHRDALKRNLLIARGYRVFTVTGRQILDTEAFDTVIHEIAKSIGYRMKSYPEGWDIRRARLRANLFTSLTDHESRRFVDVARF